MSARVPVTDWATDFDHLDPRWVNNPFPIWDELRQKCPIAHTNRYLGVYLPTRYEDVRAVAYDTQHFSSRRVIVRNVRPEPPFPSPPITSDPPHHKFTKQLMLPPFTADEMAKLKPRDPGHLQRADRQIHRRRLLRCRPAVHAPRARCG